MRLQLVLFCLCSRVNDEFIIKIGDFGLARDIYSKDYYIVSDKDRPLPVKWMALESMTEEIFSSKTDVVGIY